MRATTSAQSIQESKLKSQQERDAKIEKDGSEALKLAVAEGKIRPWTAYHIRKWEHWLQATVINKLAASEIDLHNPRIEGKSTQPKKLEGVKIPNARRRAMIAAKGCEALKRAVPERLISVDAAHEIVTDSWPHDLHAFTCSSLFGYEIDLVKTKKAKQ